MSVACVNLCNAWQVPGVAAQRAQCHVAAAACVRLRTSGCVLLRLRLQQSHYFCSGVLPVPFSCVHMQARWRAAVARLHQAADSRCRCCTIMTGSGRRGRGWACLRCSSRRGCWHETRQRLLYNTGYSTGHLENALINQQQQQKPTCLQQAATFVREARGRLAGVGMAQCSGRRNASRIHCTARYHALVRVTSAPVSSRLSVLPKCGPAHTMSSSTAGSISTVWIELGASRKLFSFHGICPPNVLMVACMMIATKMLSLLRFSPYV